MDDRHPCPCGSTDPYKTCCAPLHNGGRADSPEALMRSRFTAFKLGLSDYLLQTWHATTRPAPLNLDESPDWQSLEVLGSSQSGDTGTVHFRAIFCESGQWGYLEENSDFVREDGRWFYLTGQPEQGHFKPGRNDRCPCGSGRKFKSCCL